MPAAVGALRRSDTARILFAELEQARNIPLALTMMVDNA